MSYKRTFQATANEDLRSVLDKLMREFTALERAFSGVGTKSEKVTPVKGSIAVAGGGSVASAPASLVNDQVAPGIDMIYGTDSSGEKRWVFNPSAYSISDLDDTGEPKYFGYLGTGTEWYIMKITGGTVATYTRGTTSYSTNWTNRASLTYDTYNNVF